MNEFVKDIRSETINNQEVKERKKYEPKLYNVWGEIERAVEKRLYDKGKTYENWVRKDDVCYILHLINERPEGIKIISVFKSKLESEKVWNDIAAGRFYGKKYIFYYKKYRQYFNLINWEEAK
ncbi:hypothetical protein [endosymbiont GvMRE of Glomus versiforme]|uniref:hypothetical protein n=1 Tax=endosymbiont GvMRE of Glomus versiforme TaxID=2039283 RepID=UPI000EDE6FA8|nr:hypothetical protein [endosymbiont GvMRE of Glomus versiforme]RHZ35783.1 hypothetical protein GvMRE_Ic5g53 [endosymbiont GvMRE of Glomus versiforme]